MGAFILLPPFFCLLESLHFHAVFLNQMRIMICARAAGFSPGAGGRLFYATGARGVLTMAHRLAMIRARTSMILPFIILPATHPPKSGDFAY